MINKSAIDRIIEHLQDSDSEHKLSKDDTELLKKIDIADDLLREFGAEKLVVEMMMKKFKPIAKSTCYSIIRKTKWVYGLIYKSEKDYERRNILEELAIIYQECKKVEDWKHAIKALELRSKILRLQEEDPDIPDWTKIQEHTFIIEYNPELAGGKRIDDLEKKVEKYLVKRREQKETFIESLPEATVENA